METADLVEAVAGTVADRYVDAGPASEAAAWLRALEVAHREAARRLLAAPGAADLPEELRAELTTVLALPEEGRS